MPFLSLEHVRLSLEYMAEHTHPSLTSILALSRSGGMPGDDPVSAIAFGSVNERRLLSDYFSPVGGPEDKPFFVPFGTGRGVSHWRNNNYPGRSLQRQRTDRPEIFRQDPANNKRWFFNSKFVAALGDKPKDSIGDLPIIIAYLAAWCFRDREIQSLKEIVDLFVSEFRLREIGALESLFSEEIPENMAAAPLSANRLDDGELLQMLAGYEPEHEEDQEDDEQQPSKSGAQVYRIPEAPGNWDLTRAELTDLCGLQGLEEAAFRTIAALRAGMHVILTGAPGTGKTKLADCLCRKAGFPAWTVPATDQWTTFETIGGYFPTPSEQSDGDRLDFLPGAVVESLEKGRCLIIDEINRADIDKAFGELFTLLSGNSVTLPYRRRSKDGGFRRLRLQVGPAFVTGDESEVIMVPPWWRIIGAMNDADKASLKRLSLAFVRRFAFIPVDLPGKVTYQKILQGSLAEFSGSPSLTNLSGKYLTTLVDMFAAPETGFASIGMPMGPAIPLAMIRHAESEWQMDPTRSTESVLSSALELYVAPQFQGRSDMHSECLEVVAPHIKDASTHFAKHLAVWTGFVA